MRFLRNVPLLTPISLQVQCCKSICVKGGGGKAIQTYLGLCKKVIALLFNH